MFRSSSQHVLAQVNASPTRPIARIACTDTDQFIHPAFVDLLKSEFGVTVDAERPDLVVFGPYPGFDFLAHKDTRRLFLTEENVIADFNLADYAFGFARLDFDARYMRLPNYFFYKSYLQLLPPNQTSASLEGKDRFCNFIYSNPAPHEMREQLFAMLSGYKFVHSHGRQLSNAEPLPVATGVKGWNEAKLAVQSRYKFSIICENSSAPGYTTEKLTDAIYAGTIPIYWGNPDVARDFNAERLINVHNFKSLSDVAELVRRIDADDQLYLATLARPVFTPSNLAAAPTREKLLAFLRPIMAGTAGGRNRRVWGEIYEARIGDLVALQKSAGHLPPLVKALQAEKQGLEVDLVASRAHALATINRYADPSLADTLKVASRFARSRLRRTARYLSSQLRPK